MLVTSLVGLLITAVGAIAAPGNDGGSRHPPKHPSPPSVGPVNQIQSITCNGGGPYCCTPETDGIVVCCNSQNNQGSTSVQACAGFGGAKVIYN
ncbi:Hypothetical protein NCS54_01451100 [Fusarium falciforme]|uniref:Hypothetical protein n=1 Tax=Fusarium falciforme TaxID=195108 RepID=UPI002300C8A6|nr:Hypothetical protein NCS54_01451100 [Fusarium falciforme]WAO96824.1 Hypothetical protein NCS54_01451100 [Fusarium falciforme]